MAIVRFGELFSGPGGLSLGAKLAAEEAGVPLRHAWALDYDPSSTATYKRNFPDAEVHTEDIKKVKSFAKLGPVAGLAFGFPCNDFSVVGERLGVRGEFGPLYKHCVRAVSELEPDWFVAENVGGLRSTGKGKVLVQILEEFADLGYVLTPHLYKFEEYGVPQRRHRILIVGLRRHLKLAFNVPAPLGRMVTAREALEHPPIRPGTPNSEITRQSSAVVARLLALAPGENAFSENLPHEHRLNVRGARISQIYRRLHPDQPAYTVTGSGGGGTHVYHWSEPRALTNRERARLQTFPDSYVFEGGKEAVRRQIGMAVPPSGARAVFRSLFLTLEGRAYRSIPANLAHLIDEQALGAR